MTIERSPYDYPRIPHSKPTLEERDARALESAVLSGMIAEGRLAREFEDRTAIYLGMLGGVVASSGTAALFLALRSLGIGPGDEVVIPTYVCRSVWDAVMATGAEPHLCDVGPDWCINSESVSRVLSSRTKAIVVVHMFGIASDVESVCSLGIPVIEDCCQAFGARVGPEQSLVGTFGALCVLSFHATKLLTTGEGGMVLTDDPSLLERLRCLRHGDGSPSKGRYRSPISDLQAALGISQLERYDEFLERRRVLADLYFESLACLSLRLPYSTRDRSIFFRFPLHIEMNCEEVRHQFDIVGIQVRRGVDSLLHRWTGARAEKFPEAEKHFAETLSLPIYPSLSKSEQTRVIEACLRVIT